MFNFDGNKDNKQLAWHTSTWNKFPKCEIDEFGKRFEYWNKDKSVYDFDLTSKKEIIVTCEKYLVSNPPFEEIHPFNYYYSPIPEIIISSIIGNHKDNQQPLFLHTLFASLNPHDNEQLIKWCEYFGYPLKITCGFLHTEEGKKLWCDHTEESCEKYMQSSGHYYGHLDSFRDAIYEIKEIIYLYNLLITKDCTSLRQYLMDCAVKKTFILAYYYYSNNELIEDINANPLLLAMKIIERTLHIHHEVSPNFNFKNIGDNHYVPAIDWDFDTLLSNIKFMFMLDFSSNKSPRPCLNPLCNRYFSPTREDAVYCSETCKNRVRQQRHRAKLKSMKDGG